MSRLPDSLRAAALAASFVVVAAACVGPARTIDDYRHKADSSVRSAGSAVATASVGVQLVRHDDAFAGYLSVLFGSAERDVESVSSTFASIQPPDRRADRLRARVTNVLGDAQDTLGRLRIAVRRHDWGTVERIGRELPPLRRRLHRLEA